MEKIVFTARKITKFFSLGKNKHALKIAKIISVMIAAMIFVKLEMKENY